MRKSLSPSPGDSLSTARVFGIPLERVQQSGQPGHEVPLLVKHIVDYIEEHGGLDMEGLFQVNGNAERVEWLRQRYDNGEEVDLEKEADLASAVCLLRLFLQELPQPVIPPSLQTHVLRLYQEDNSEEELSRNMKYYLQQMPPVNYNLLRFLCRFLANVATLQEESWSTGALAAVFGPDIFHLDTYVEDQKEQESIGRILAELLDNQEEIFDSEEDDISTTNDYSSINEQVWGTREESESGEAQLSPLAGRMVPLPLEDGTLPHARRFLDFGHSQRFLQQDPDSTSYRPRRASFSSRESVKGDSVTQQLSKKLQSLKKKIRQFEEQFEKEKKYKPSHGDKVANPKVLKWMTDLTKIRKQIKDAKHRADGELAPQLRPRSNTLPKSFGSTLEHSASEGPERRPTHQETLEFIQQRIRRKREEDGWPEDVREQLDSEKMMLQKYLLHYEGLHGRPVTREERLRVKPLYDRYRLVKQMVTRVSITPIIASPSSKRRNQTLQPIIEGETAHFCDEIKEEEEDLEEQKADEVSPALEVILSLGSDAQTSSQKPPQPKTEEGPGKMGLGLDLRLSSSSMPELLEQLWKARAEKKKLGKTIREFEDEFYQQNGRNVQKEDKLPMMDEYKEYKRIKAKLRLLEVLISKQDSSKSI
uniref:Rho-GAP domain-containing protein n=1 Tax=Denticeps clupeoides TaxID=299321 RepID=A0AAY4E991_9TELE